MLDLLLAADHWLLRFLNLTLSHPWSDRFWLTITQLHKTTAFIYFVLPLICALLIYRVGRHAIPVLIALICAIGLTDAVTYRLVKKNFHRDRPFVNEDVSSWVRKVGEAHGSSFPSNHAANAFAGAYILGWYFRRRRHYFYAFAALIALSRPALGVHFPSDILVGASLGFSVAALVVFFGFSRWSWFHPPMSVSKARKESWSWRSRNRRLKQG